MTIRVVVCIAATMGIAVGFAIGWWLRGDDDKSAPVPAAIAHRPNASSGNFDAALAVVRDDLAFERDARVALADQMERKIERLQQSFAQRPASPARSGATSSPHVGTLGDPLAAEAERASESEEPWFDDTALLELGVPAGEVQNLREHFEETELEMRYLRDRAAREGWASSNRFGVEFREKRNQLRELLGDDAYDKILYATGRSNRVRLMDAFEQSAATEAGIRKGDVVFSYAGKRVFDPTSLYLWSTQGEPGSRTEIKVSRDGEIIRHFVPRGPLGARFSHERVAPR